ncbi:MAG: hypothetical protein JWN33_529 [Candidatus Saccharibacteria bacterium]|nr:hypothetical protein [Candidatus Saccharibacteria bacterium]
MSRDKKIKQARLVETEGRHDRAWCHLLKAIYTDQAKYSVVIESANGGSPAEVVQAAINKQKLVSGSFEHVVAIVDGDKTAAEIEEARVLSDKHNVELIIVTPCMEALLLNILEPQKNWYNTAKGHKSYFQRKYIRSDRRTAFIHYLKVFKPDSIEAASKSDPVLLHIIDVISGK